MSAMPEPACELRVTLRVAKEIFATKLDNQHRKIDVDPYRCFESPKEKKKRSTALFDTQSPHHRDHLFPAQGDAPSLQEVNGCSAFKVSQIFSIWRTHVTFHPLSHVSEQLTLGKRPAPMGRRPHQGASHARATEKLLTRMTPHGLWSRAMSTTKGF